MGIVEVLEKDASSDGDGFWRHQVPGDVTSAVNNLRILCASDRTFAEIFNAAAKLL